MPIESLCLFSFGLSSQIKKAFKRSNSQVCSNTFLRFWNLLVMVSRSFPCSSFTWLPIVDLSIDSWRQRSLHHTDHTWNNKQCFLDSQLEVYVPLVWMALWSSDLSKQAGHRHQSFNWDHWVGVLLHLLISGLWKVTGASPSWDSHCLDHACIFSKKHFNEMSDGILYEGFRI